MSRKLINLHEKDIPEWIRSSPYLQSLLENGPLPEEGLQVPELCLKRNTTINCHTDALQFLRTVRYWLMSDENVFDSNFLQFCFMPNKTSTWDGNMRELEHEHPVLEGLAAIVRVAEDERVTKAAECGNYYILRFLCEEKNRNVDETTAIAAIRYGHVSCLEYVHSQGLVLRDTLMIYAAAFGSLSCLKYLRHNGLPFSVNAMSEAVIGNHHECLVYMLQNRSVSRYEIKGGVILSSCNIIAQSGKLGTLKIVLIHLPFSEIHEEIFTGAAEGGHLPILRYCVDNKIQPADRIQSTMINSCARGGYLDCVEYLYSIGFVGDRSTLEAAARGGCVKCIRFLLEKGCPISGNLCAILAEHGHYDGVEYGRKNDFPWDERTFAGGAKNSLMLLTFAHQKGCPWDTHTCIAAAGAGRLDCLRYAYTHGCPWDARTCAAAARGGHLDCFTFARGNGCPWKLKSKTRGFICEAIAVSAARAPTVDCLRYVLEHGARVRKAAAFNAARAGCLQSLQLLHCKGCPLDKSVCTEAARVGALDCLRFLHEQGCPWDKDTYIATFRTANDVRRETNCGLDEAFDIADRIEECSEYLKLHKCPGSHEKYLFHFRYLSV